MFSLLLKKLILLLLLSKYSHIVEPFSTFTPKPQGGGGVTRAWTFLYVHS